MPNNHFYIPYAGNKRNEFKEFYNNINLENINTIIEPFAGTHAISYFLWEKHPNLKFILNDITPHFKEMYEIYKDEKKIDEFNEISTNLIKSFKNDKNKYLEVVNAPTIYAWFIGQKIYNIRPKLYPLTKKYKEEIDLRKYPIYNFYKNANIEFYNEDGINIYEKYKNDESTLLFLDPPYLQSYNDFYEKNNKRINIYEYLYNNNINNEKANIFLMLEDIWINRLLFKNNHIFEKYKKMYAPKQKITNHILITKSSF